MNCKPGDGNPPCSHDLDRTGAKLRPPPDYSLETSLLRQGFECVAGVDEAGRGPLAGPVVAAAVRLCAGRIPDGLNDSKKLTPKSREQLNCEIRRVADVSVAYSDPAEIDRVNILNATMAAMRRAVRGLPQAADYAIVDGNRIPEGLACPAQALVKGDARSVSVAAASIIAKVERDKFMKKLALMHPEYCWDRNSGYGTREHIEVLMAIGPTRHHRQSFAPVRRAASRLSASLPG